MDYCNVLLSQQADRKQNKQLVTCCIVLNVCLFLRADPVVHQRVLHSGFSLLLLHEDGARLPVAHNLRGERELLRVRERLVDLLVSDEQTNVPAGQRPRRRAHSCSQQIPEVCQIRSQKNVQIYISVKHITTKYALWN